MEHIDLLKMSAVSDLPTASLQDDLRKVLDCFAARVPLQELIYEIAARLHEPAAGPPTAAEIRQGAVQVVQMFRELRQRLHLS
ncbi:MAG TPA: hypothetical protein VHR66_31130 [Gemmataceae bacterium]|jgi:hypothetical protein|nr:hypothetical protein [Gemmataceae bacterium]